MNNSTQLKSGRAVRRAYVWCVLTLLTVLAQPPGARAQTTWTTSGTNISNANSGNVGVGTTAPGAKLDVGAGAPARGSNSNLLIGMGAGSAAQVEFYGPTRSSVIAHTDSGGLSIWMNAPNWLNAFTITNNGSVGVGTPSPTERLHVTGARSRLNNILVGETRAGGAAPNGEAIEALGNHLVFMTGASYDFAFGAPGVLPNVIFKGSGNVGIGTTTPNRRLELVQDVGGLSFEAGTGSPNSGAIRFGDNTGWKLHFGRSRDSVGGALNSGTAGVFMTIQDNGSVGVGTTAPGYRFDVQGGAVNASGGLCIAGDCKTSWSQVGGGSSQWAGGADSSINYGSGNVGIGTASPAERLEVSGSGEVKARVTGTISAGIQFRETTDANTWSEWQQFLDRFRLNTHDGTTTRPDVMSVLPNGNVGIGKAAPTEALDVVGNIKATGSVSATYQDVAEWVPSTQNLSAGTVVVLDAGRSNHVVASSAAYDTKVAGVVSERPGVILGVAGEGKVKVATTGRVKIKVDASRGAVKVGDLLVTSGVEGVAMKSVPVDLGGTQIHRPGTIIGKALEPLDKGVGEILVLLSLQ